MIPRGGTALLSSNRENPKAAGEEILWIWASSLNAKRKVHATNTWGVAVLRYYMTVVGWSSTTLDKLDKKTRSIIRKYKGHHRCASIERLYLNQKDGGRGLMSVQQQWEKEQISLIAYLQLSEDEWLKAVLQNLEKRTVIGKANPLMACRQLIVKYDIQHPTTIEQVQNLSMMLARRQQLCLEKALEDKAIHGAHRTIINSGSYGKEGTFAWLQDGRYRVETESLLIAAQDGSLLLNQFETMVTRRGENPRCRVCKEENETIGHVLSACTEYKWDWYKKRHDKVLSVIVKAIAHKWQILTPYDAAVGGAYKCAKGTMIVDTTMPTDDEIIARRPDLIIRINSSKIIWILDVACTWEPLVSEREKEKMMKYRLLVSDMGRREPQWSVRTTAVVVGVLGAIGNLRGQLAQLNLWSPDEIAQLMKNIQYFTLNAAVQLLRRHLAYV